MKTVNLLMILLAFSSFHSVKSQLDILFFEENFARVEDATDNMIQVIKSGPNSGPIEVRIDLFTVAEFMADGGILPGGVNDPADFEVDELSDYNNAPLFVTFPPSNLEMVMSVSLGSTIIADTINEGQEGLVMVLVVSSIDPADEANLIIPSTRGVALLFITDDDDIEIGFSQPALTVSEGDGTVTQVSVGILNGGTTEQSFTFLITYNDGTVLPFATSSVTNPTMFDFTIVSPVMPGGNTGILQFGPTATSFDITFEVNDDPEFESNEVFSASISSTSSTPFGITPSPAAQNLDVTIEDNEGPLEVGFSQAEFRVSEGAMQVTIPFQFFNPVDPSSLPFSIFVALTVSVMDGTAMLSQHYDIVFMNNPNILVGILPEGMVILEIIDDQIVNEDRTLSLTLTANPGSPPVLITINETVVIIEDDDPQVPVEPTNIDVFVVTDPPIVPEGGAFLACFTISATPFGSDYMLVNIADNTPGGELLIVTNDILTFNAGTSELTQCTLALLSSDNIIEGSSLLRNIITANEIFLGETVPVILGEILAVDTSVAIIGFQQVMHTFSEGSIGEVCVTVDAVIEAPPLLVAVLAYVPNTANPALGDYEQGSNIITFGPATTNQMECVNVTIIDNEGSESEEMFSIRLTAAQAPLVIDPARGMTTVTIPQDN